MTNHVVHISDVPKDLIRVRDKWRHFWQWVPILGLIYGRYYRKKWKEWSIQNDVWFIVHNGQQELTRCRRIIGRIE